MLLSLVLMEYDGFVLTSSRLSDASSLVVVVLKITSGLGAKTLFPLKNFDDDAVPFEMDVLAVMMVGGGKNCRVIVAFSLFSNSENDVAVMSLAGSMDGDGVDVVTADGLSVGS